MKACEISARRIKSQISQLIHLHVPDGVQSETLYETIQEFEGIHQGLITIQDEAVNKSNTRKILPVPKNLDKLNEIASRLAKKDDMLKMLGMIGVLKVEHHANWAQIFKVLKSMGASSCSTKSRLEGFCETKVIQQAVKEITNRIERCSTDQMTELFNLSTGVCLYKAEFGVQNFEVAAQYFN